MAEHILGLRLGLKTVAGLIVAMLWQEKGTNNLNPLDATRSKQPSCSRGKEDEDGCK